MQQQKEETDNERELVLISRDQTEEGIRAETIPFGLNFMKNFRKN